MRRYAEMLAELQPDSPWPWRPWPPWPFSDGDYAAAARHCRTLPRRAPDRFENWFNLGVAYHKMGSYEKAAQAYKQATRLQPDNRAGAPQSGRGAAGTQRSGGRARLL